MLNFNFHSNYKFLKEASKPYPLSDIFKIYVNICLGIKLLSNSVEVFGLAEYFFKLGVVVGVIVSFRASNKHRGAQCYLYFYYCQEIPINIKAD